MRLIDADALNEYFSGLYNLGERSFVAAKTVLDIINAQPVIDPMEVVASEFEAGTFDPNLTVQQRANLLKMMINMAAISCKLDLTVKGEKIGFVDQQTGKTVFWWDPQCYRPEDWPDEEETE